MARSRPSEVRDGSDISVDRASDISSVYWADVIVPILLAGAVLGLTIFMFLKRGRHVEGSALDKLEKYCTSNPLAAMMIFASVALSAASYWATFGGALEVVQNVFVALLLTFGIQLMMLVVAWQAGFSFFGASARSRFGAGIVFIMIFFGMMSVSSFFAYAKFFDIVFVGPEREDWAQATTANRISAALSDLEDLTKEAYLDEWRDVEADWQAFKDNISGVATAESQRREKLRNEAAERQVAEQNRQIQLVNLDSEIERLKLSVGSLTEELNSLLGQFERTEDELRAWQSEHGPTLDEIALLDKKIEDEIAGERGGRNEGCGPVCRELQEERRQLLQPLEDGPIARRQLLEENREDLGNRIEELRNLINDAEIELRRKEIEKRGLSGGGDSDALEFYELRQRGMERLDAVGGLSSLVIEFENEPTRADWDVIERRCRELASPGQADAVSCGLQTIQGPANELIALYEAQEYLATNCRVDDTIASTSTPDQLIALAFQCIGNSALDTTSAQPIRDAVQEIRRTRSADAHHFTLVLSALNDQETLAQLAVGFAVLIDLMVLAAAIFGAIARRDPLMEIGLSATEASEMTRALDRQEDPSLFATVLLEQLVPSNQPGYSNVDLAGLHREDSADISSFLLIMEGAQRERGKLVSVDTGEVGSRGFSISSLMIAALNVIAGTSSRHPNIQ